jgi:hypothetical protein
VSADRALAVARARRAFLLSGHPNASWSVVLVATVEVPPLASEVRSRLEQVFGSRPDLGPVPDVISVAAGDGGAIRRRFADRPYLDDEPGVRVGLADEGPRVLLAAHHGLLDGLGLVALMGVTLGEPMRSSAKGLGDRSSTRSFGATAVARVWEALVRPPDRVAPARSEPAEDGDHLAERECQRLSGGTAGLIAAARSATEAWNRKRHERVERFVVAVGASRRDGGDIDLHEASTYLRFRPGRGEADVRAQLAAARPQPGGPTLRTLGPLAPVAGALSRRLGSTMLVSNLGALSGPTGLLRVEFYPVSHGRSGVALGAASTTGRTVLTLRARRSDFDESDLQRLLGMIAERLPRPGA